MQQPDHSSSSESPSNSTTPVALPTPIAAAVVTRRPVSSEHADEGISSRYRIRPDEFLSYCDSDERTSLQLHLSAAVVHFLDREVAIYLEGLGIFFPVHETKQRARTLREKLLVHNDSVRTVRFEKCSELVPYHWEKFGQIVETRDLVQQLYQHLPAAMRSKWSETEARRILRGYIGFIRREIVLRGYSAELSQIADFFALHNRQGKTENDWFAGADIFILPRYEQTLFIEPCVVKERPALENSWELLEAAFGAPIAIMNINIIRELSVLGYDTRGLDAESAIEEKEIPVAVFARKDDRASLVYCTNGLRRLSRSVKSSESPKPGNELVFQLAVSPQDVATISGSDVPDWPLRPLTMGWILMQSARSRTIKTGAGLTCDVPLIRNGDTELRNIFATSFACVRSEQLCSDGPFTYINLIGITSDEARVASKFSPEFLLRLLEHKELDQCTKPNRSSIVARTGLLEEQTAPKAPVECSKGENVEARALPVG